jgi:hypothetical protein
VTTRLGFAETLNRLAELEGQSVSVLCQSLARGPAPLMVTTGVAGQLSMSAVRETARTRGVAFLPIGSARGVLGPNGILFGEEQFAWAAQMTPTRLEIRLRDRTGFAIEVEQNP